MHTIKNRKDAKVRAILYLALTVGLCVLVGIIAILVPNDIGILIYSTLQKLFTAIAVLAVLITRSLTKDKSSWNLSLKVWKNRKILLFSALLPGGAVLLGAGIYYIVFPNELYPNIQSLFEFCVQYGFPVNVSVNPITIVITTIVIWIVSILAIPIHLLELGEEIGWRGYLFPQFLKFMSVKKAVIVSGALWGIMHAPLIYFGFNYGSNYWGAPYSGIVVMMVLCIGLGIWMSYTMLKTNNCMYAAIIHGAINVAADIQIISIVANRPLLGPSPTGIIGMSVILIGAVIIFLKFIPNKSKANTL